MKKKIFTLVCLFCICCVYCYADKQQDYQNTYNYKRAVELHNENNDEDAMKYFLMELKDHKDNGYAWAWLASLQKQNQPGEALNNINFALKYLSKKDTFYAFSLALRSNLYESLGDEKKAMDDLNTLVKMFPKEADSYNKRGEYYIDKDNFELALVDFEKATELASGDASYYVGAGICYRNLKKYPEALEKFNYAIKLDDQYSQAYAQRGYCYYLMKKYQEASDDVVKTLDIETNDLAFMVMTDIADSAFEAIDFKLKLKQMMKPNNPFWPYYRGYIRENSKMYGDAIDFYKDCQKIEYNSGTISRMANCYFEMGDFESALKAINEGLETDSTNVDMCMDKAEYLDELGRTDEAIAEYTHVIELAPDYYGGYHKRGWVKDRINDTDGAIEDYSMSIMVDPSYAYNYLCRGSMYQRKGMNEQAKADFEEVIKRDTVPSQYEAAFYAYLALGEKEKGIAALDSVMKTDSLTRFYDAACFYSRLQDKNKALSYFQKALENGFRRFNHIDRDDDLDFIRDTDEFKALMTEYRKKAEEERLKYSSKQNNGNDSEIKGKVEEIPFTHEGGVTKVKCKINELPLHFVFDTGASDVSISTVEATFMLKNGYLSSQDISGKQRYVTADGNISEGTTINLKCVEIGTLKLNNVHASVVKSQKAPLLLGQSVLQQLGKIEIDNSKHVLKITSRK